MIGDFTNVGVSFSSRECVWIFCSCRSAWFTTSFVGVPCVASYHATAYVVGTQRSRKVVVVPVILRVPSCTVYRNFQAQVCASAGNRALDVAWWFPAFPLENNVCCACRNSKTVACDCPELMGVQI